MTTTPTTTTTYTADDILGFVAEYISALDAEDIQRRSDYLDAIAKSPADRQRMVDTWGNRSYTYSSDRGRRYIRIVQHDMMGHAQTGQRSVHAFVEVTTGLVYKPAGWTAPAKGARYDLTSETDRALIAEHCEFSGGYLYADRVAEIRRSAEEVAS